MDLFGTGQFHSTQELPEHQRRLHRQVLAAERAARETAADAHAVTEEERRWPGLTNPDDDGRPTSR